MARTEENEKHVWGTWEELLLASAVNRHGSKNWDSIAMEVQKRCSSPHLLLTPHNCKQKYRDLHRRFTEQGLVKNKDETTGNDDDDDDDGKIPWLEELRKLRVIELRRQVQRSDTSIVSLQLKVKRLKEEREQSMRESENAELKSDPERNTVEENQKRDLDEQVRSPSTIGKPVSGENSDRDNESISTGPKAGRDEPEKKPEPVKVNDEKLDPVAADADSAGDKPAGESSCNGSSETIGQKSVEAVPNREADESAEVWESGTEFKERGESTAKESSDVQSSTSLSRKNQRQKVVSGSSSGGEEPEVSPRKSGESQPLKRFLEIIISHKYGPIFERRLDSQETNKYKSLIRQHLDLEIVHTRLKEGYYSGCNSKFFRDLLLLFNNALVFFPRNSPEFIAAHELRQLSSKEMAVHFLKSNQRPTKPKQSNKPKPLSSILKSDPEPLDSLLVKPKSSGGSLVVCKKRSSITAKAASSVGEKKAEPKTAVVEEKKPATSDKKEAADTLLVIEQQSVINKRKRDKSRSSRQINKNQNASTTASNNNNSNKNSNLGSNQISNPPLNPMTEGKGVTVIAAPPPAADVEDDNSELKSDKEKKSITTVAKKRSVANFLNRMKRNSSSNGTLLETLKNTPENANNVKGADSNPGKGGGTKEQKKSSGTTTEQKKGNGTTTTDQKKGGSGTTTTTDQKKGGSGTTTTTDQKKSGGGTTTAEQKKSGGGTSTEQKKSGGTTAEQKKGSGPSEAKKSSAKNDDKKGNGSRNTTSGKHAQEQRNSSSPGKRSVGRPASKRKAATSPVPSPPVSSKRTREKEKVEVEAAAASKQPRKRTRR